MNPDGRSCAACGKSHRAIGENLECRANPPLMDIARFAKFPVVQPDFYCHDQFERALGAAEETFQ